MADDDPTPDDHPTPGGDLLLTGARTAAGEALDVAITDGVITATGPPGTVDGPMGAPVIDGRGQLLLPGGVDPHLHFNEPGPRTIWEGWATGTAALAAGGMTTVCEMPLNASPPTTSTAALHAKLAAARGAARVDFGLWGGVVPGNAGELPGLADRGVVAFKAFMSQSGVADFPVSDPATLRRAMEVIAGLPTARLLAVHAEDDAITHRRAATARAAGAVAVRDYLDSRPVAAETAAIARAIELAAQTGCPLHVVHVSSGAGVALVAQARADGIDVSCEVTAHHLVLDERDAERLGAIAKCAPPLRPATECEALWRCLAAGEIGFVVSDHSPCPPELKDGDAFTAWGGISGGQSTLELVVSEAQTHGRLPAAELPQVLAAGAAERLGLGGKGALRVGMDGDLVLAATGTERRLAGAELHDRHRLSPYVGRSLHSRVTTTILRGHVIYADGALRGEPRGRLVTPGRAAQNPSR
jgi:allantoinase